MFFDILKLLFGRKSLRQKDKISEQKLNRWQTEKKILQREVTIAEEKQEIKGKKKELSFSKKMHTILLINSFILELIVILVTIQSFHLAYITGGSPDFTPLVTLIGIILGQTVEYGIYSNKSKAENMQGGLTYELAMRENEKDEEAKG